MKFTEQFNKYACVGDSIRLRISDDVSLVATIKADEDERPRTHLYSEDERLRWEKDEWFFCAVVLSLELRRRELCDCLVSEWGIECNFGDDNSHLSEVADALLPEAFDEAVEWLKDTAKAARAGAKAINAIDKEVNQ